MRRFTRVVRVGIAAMVLSTSITLAAERKVEIDKLPKAVIDAVKAKFSGAELKGAESEEEDGQTIYEVAIVHKGLTYDVSLLSDGKIIEIEKLITAKDLPAVITKAVDSKYPKATITKAEEITKGDKQSFEVLIVTAEKKTIEIVLDPAGKIIEEEAKDEANDPAARYEQVRKIKLGGEGGWDFLEVDTTNRRLFVSRSTRVVVIDLDSERVIGEIPDTPGVHGIAFVPALNRGFTSNGGDSTVTAFDLKSLKPLGKIKANGRPDIIIYEPVSHRILSFNHGTNDITAIDPEAMTAVGSLAAEGVPELAVSDDKGHVWVNLEDKSEILQFDAKTLKVLNKFSLAPGEEPTGLAFDPKTRKLFSTCNNKTLVIADADSGKVVQTLPIGPGPDGCVRDVSTGLIFASSGGDGTVAVVREASPGNYEVAKSIKTQVSAKTIALDPKTHRLYLSAATPDPTPAPPNPDKNAPRPRRRYLPDSFVVVVVGP